MKASKQGQTHPIAMVPSDRLDDLHGRIAERAYHLYLRRGRTPGGEIADWLEAERLVQAEMRLRRETEFAAPPVRTPPVRNGARRPPSATR